MRGPLLLAAAVSACTSNGPGSGVRHELRDATSDGPLDGCHVPPGVTALCITFNPDKVAPDAEWGLDERGFLELEVFDQPSLPLGPASSLARYDRIIPGDADAGHEIALADLPAPTILFDNPPATVFVRALFFDHGGFDSRGAYGWGTWIGGMDLSRGLVQSSGLLPVTLDPGHVTRLELPLRALRRLRTTVTTSATPLGDGQGSLSIVVSGTAALPPNTTTYGYGIDPCVDVTRGPQVVDVAALGPGTFYVVGFFDDLGIQTPGAVPPGTMLTLHDVDASTGGGTYDVVTVADGQYSAEVSLDLGYVTPFTGDPSAIPPNSCADLGLPPP